MVVDIPRYKVQYQGALGTGAQGVSCAAEKSNCGTELAACRQEDWPRRPQPPDTRAHGSDGPDNGESRRRPVSSRCRSVARIESVLPPAESQTVVNTQRRADNP
ncbi:hypothetical protein GN956_G15214 [Arapaima gigas]